MTVRLPSLNGLRAFEAAARHRSFTKAGIELNISQTAVSHRIRRLEEELGMRLFDRAKEGISLTQEGHGYLPGVRAAFRDIRLATERLRSEESDNVLTLSTLPSFAAKWLLPRLPSFLKVCPHIEVRVIGSTDIIDLEANGVDGAIRYGSGNWPGVRADRLMTDQLFPVCSPELLGGVQPLLRLEDLGSHTLLQTSGMTAGDWPLWLAAAGVSPDRQPDPKLTFNLTFMTIQAAIDGLGVAIGRKTYVEADLALGRLVAPFDIMLPSDGAFYFVSPADGATAPKIATFREWLLGQAYSS